jgi:hypothetical protein
MPLVVVLGRKILWSCSSSYYLEIGICIVQPEVFCSDLDMYLYAQRRDGLRQVQRTNKTKARRLSRCYIRSEIVL